MLRVVLLAPVAAVLSWAYIYLIFSLPSLLGGF